MVQTWKTIGSEVTAHEAGDSVPEEELGAVQEKLIENRSLVIFWETLKRQGVGTNTIEIRAEKIRIRKVK